MELTTNYGWSMPEPTDPVNSSAEYAENMELIDGVVKDIADEVTLVDQGLTALSTTVAGKVNKTGDTMTGALSMSGSKIQNVASPTQANDAATKSYVDNTISTAALPITGGTMAGDIDMDGNKITDLVHPGPGVVIGDYDATPRWYVDDAITALDFLPTEGGTMTGDINMNNNHVSALATPTFNYDAATKKYVDDADALALPLTGGTMEGSIDMSDNGLTVSSISARPGAGRQIDIVGRTDFNGYIVNNVHALSGLDTDSIVDPDNAANKEYVDNADGIVVNLDFTQGHLYVDTEYSVIKNAIDQKKKVTFIFTSTANGQRRYSSLVCAVTANTIAVLFLNSYIAGTVAIRVYYLNSDGTNSFTDKTL